MLAPPFCGALRDGRCEIPFPATRRLIAAGPDVGGAVGGIVGQRTPVTTMRASPAHRGFTRIPADEGVVRGDPDGENP